MSEENLERSLARLLGVDTSQLARALGQAAHAAGSVADAAEVGRRILARLEAMRAQGGPFKAVGPDDDDVSRRLAEVERTGVDPGPSFNVPPAGED